MLEYPLSRACSSEDRAAACVISESSSFVDWSTGLIAIYLFWQHPLVAALLMAFVPPVGASALLIRFADRESRFGRYVLGYMTGKVEAMRFARFVLTAFGGWFRLLWLIALGLVVLILA